MSALRIDLDEDTPDLSALPRIQRAPMYRRRLRVLFMGSALLGLSMLIAARVYFVGVLHVALANGGASLLLLAAGLQSAYWVAQWRVTVAAIPLSVATTEIPLPTVKWRRWLMHARSVVVVLVRVSMRAATSRGGQALWLALFCVIAIATIKSAWDLQLVATLSSVAAKIAGSSALAFAFGVLVLERHCASGAIAEWPERQQLAQLARVVLAIALLTALGLLTADSERLRPLRLLSLAALLPLIVAIEWLLRALLLPFSPSNPRIEPAMLADSIAAGLLRWPLRPLKTLQDELQQRFGIDLRQNWAFAFMRRAFLPVLSTIVMLGWLLTGVTQIAVEGRGVYERFGKPIAVWHSGLHVGLPWPFGQVRAVENGVVRTLGVSTAGDEEKESDDKGTADGSAPDSANRLWDVTHTEEKSQVIASLSGDKQSFHIVNMDVLLVYRIALDDQAALAATYNNTDREALLRSMASQILVRKFASRTLDAVLGQQRIELGNEIADAIQNQLNAARSGVEILAAIVEAIHPPAGAANAYHSVQAAQIKAQALIARERGTAAEELNLAQLKAGMASDKATAQARETKASAEAANLRYAAERDAYRTAGKAFVFEHYLTQLSHGLSGAALIVVDHRIGAGSAAPTIDLRSYSAALDANAARRVEP